jgi:hypothetical protein
MITFVLLVWFHTSYSDVQFRVGGFDRYEQCETQGKKWDADHGARQTPQHACIPVNHY